MTRKQHLKNIETVCGSKTRREVFDWLEKMTFSWCYDKQENENCGNFICAFYDYLSKVRKDVEY